MRHVIVTIEVRPGCVDDFLRLVAGHQAASRDEPGCYSFDVARRDGYSFLLAEIFRDSRALAAHQQTPHYARWRATIGDLAAARTHLEFDSLCVVLTNGCFDGPALHPGHLYLIDQAADLGDVLIVAVNSDSSVRSLKGEGRPIVPLSERMARLADLPCVHRVVSFRTEEELETLISDVRPDMLVKGSDWQGKPITGSWLAGRVHFVERLPGHSTTATTATTATGRFAIGRGSAS